MKDKDILSGVLVIIFLWFCFKYICKPCEGLDPSEIGGNIIRNLDISKQRFINTLSDDYEYSQQYINEHIPEQTLKPYLDPKPEDVSYASSQCSSPSIWDSVWEQRQLCEQSPGCVYEKNTYEWNTCKPSSAYEPWTCEKISEIGWNNEVTDDENLKSDRINKCENNTYGLNCGIAYPETAGGPLSDRKNMVCEKKW
jgi:hypothetical protein